MLSRSWTSKRVTNTPGRRANSESAAIGHGHIGAGLISLAAMLRIPVYMHNVPEEDLFRPSAWNAFGTAEREGADFRACANFGPLYK
jgi:L-fucose isomerase